MNTQEDILFTELGSLGVITLNRPQALNALSHAMAVALNEKLKEWQSDDEVKAVLIYADNGKAFCAGGDIRSIYDGRLDPELKIKQFFWDEYRLNRCIQQYNKPYIALLDGITMGGGVGISIHGSHRVVTENFSFAMPETGIGFYPDVGGSYLLSRCPGQTGIYLGLTGARIKAADAVYVGLADHFVLSEHKAELIDALASAQLRGDAHAAFMTIVKNYSTMPESAPLAGHRELIDKYFAFNTVEEIIEALQLSNNEWGLNTAKTLLSKCPTSLKVTLQQLRNAKHMDFDQCMQMEYRMTIRFLQEQDFYEGIRAVIIDKDQKPNWRPAELQHIKQTDIDKYFAPLENTSELHFS